MNVLCLVTQGPMHAQAHAAKSLKHSVSMQPVKWLLLNTLAVNKVLDMWWIWPNEHRVMVQHSALWACTPVSRRP